MFNLLSKIFGSRSTGAVQEEPGEAPGMTLEEILKDHEGKIRNLMRDIWRIEKRLERLGLVEVDKAANPDQPAITAGEPGPESPAPQEGDNLLDFPEYMQKISGGK